MSEPQAATDETNISKGMARGALIGVTSVQVVATMAVMIPPAIAPALAEAFDLPVALIGLQVSFAYVGATMMSVAAGLAVRKFGAVRVNQLAALLIACSLSLMTVPHPAGLVLGTFGVGVAYGMTNPAASHLMIRIANAGNRNLIFSIKQTGQPMGGVLAGVMAPPVAVAFGWQWALFCGAGLAAAALVAVQPLRRIFDADRDPTTRFRGAVFRDIGLVLSVPAIRTLAFACLAFSSVQLALMAFVVTLLVEDVGFSLVTAGVGLAVLQVAGVIGRLGWGIYADKSGNGLKTLVIVQVISVLSAIMTAFFSPEVPTWFVYFVLALFGASAVGWNGVFMAEIARLAPPGRAGSATGGVLVLVFIGVIIGPLVFTAVQQAVGSYAASFLIMAGISIAGIVPIALLWRRGT